MLGAQKKPQHEAGVVSLFAVTHQGPAQGGKAGGGEPPACNLSNSGQRFKPIPLVFPKYSVPQATILHSPTTFFTKTPYP